MGAFAVHPEDPSVVVYRTGDVWKAGQKFTGVAIVEEQQLPAYDPTKTMSGMDFNIFLDILDSFDKSLFRYILYLPR